MLVDRLMADQTRRSTIRTYQCIWRQFNTFIISLDVIPPSWEERTTLFIAYLIQKECKVHLLSLMFRQVRGISVIPHRGLLGTQWQWVAHKIGDG